MDQTIRTDISEAVKDSINEQIKHELHSAYLYLSMVGYFESANLKGFAHWMRLQSQEELEHAMKFFNFLLERGEKPVLQTIDQPRDEFHSPLDVFEQALGHEREITALIHKLYALSVEEKDYPAQLLLQWFVNEQVEEEQNASAVVESLRMAGEDGAALLLLDRELGSRQE